jgi:nucleoside-diphosphate-sugar epimerase
MDLRHEALRAGPAPPTGATVPRPTVLVAGGGGPLGSAVLEALLASRALAHVRVLVAQEFHASVQGLEPWPVASLDAAPGRCDLADLALVVFDRERHANGRDAAFLRPQPERLPALAAWLRCAGARDLIVVLPHAAAMLPQALRAGLANLDEQAVAALGFAHVVFVRSAQAPVDTANRGLQRLADLVLAQLRLMTPQNLQPVRAAKLAQLVVVLAASLPHSREGTRVMAPELVWQAAQLEHPGALVRAWLADEPLPDISVRVPRM